jgi:hypothetical protein
MNKENFLIESQVFYYIEKCDDRLFEFLDERAKVLLIKDRLTNGDSINFHEFKFMVENTKYFTDYLEYNVYQEGEELSDSEFNLLSDEQKIEYCELLDKMYNEDEVEYNDGSLSYWRNNPLYIWYNSFKREQQIKTVLDD